MTMQGDEYAQLSALARVVIRRADLVEAEQRLHEAVDMARRAGLSWVDIGRVLGTSRQSAWERFGKVSDE